MADRIWIGTTDGNPNVATNWSPNTVPINGDRQIFDYRATRNLDANLASLAAINGSIVIDHSFTRYIGDGTAYYQTAATAVDIGQMTNGSATGGSSRIMLASGAAVVTYSIRRTATVPASTEASLQPLRITGSALTVNVSGNSKLGVAQLTGETATVTALRLTANDDGVPSVELGRGVTVTAQTINAGDVHSISDNTTTTTIIDGGIYDHEGSGGHTNVTAYAGSTFKFSGTGGITGTLIVQGATFDASRVASNRTIATARFYAGSTVDLDNGVAGSIIFTNAVEYPDGVGALASFRTPPNVKGTLVSI